MKDSQGDIVQLRLFLRPRFNVLPQPFGNLSDLLLTAGYGPEETFNLYRWYKAIGIQPKAHVRCDQSCALVPVGKWVEGN